MKHIIIIILLAIASFSQAQCPLAEKLIESITNDTDGSIIVRNTDKTIGSIQLPKYYDHDLLKVTLKGTLMDYENVSIYMPWEIFKGRGYYTKYLINDNCILIVIYNVSMNALMFLREEPAVPNQQPPTSNPQPATSNQ